MASTPFLSANSRSSESFSVSEGTRTGMPGRLMPLFSPSMPPLMMSQITSSPIDFVDAQLDQAVGEQDARALLDVFGEGLESGAHERCGAGHVARGDGEPVAGLEQDGLTWSLSLEVRILGPCRSPRMQSGLRSSRLTLRIIWMSASFSSCVPWEKFRRTTSTPARTRSRKTGSVLEAGPSVATIFARRWDGESVRLISANGMGRLQMKVQLG